MGTYRKMPVVIEAWKIPETAEAAEWLLTEIDHGGDVYVVLNAPDEEGSYGGIAIDTLEGTMRGDPGDWLIRGIKGEFYPCKPDVFEATYESVT